MTKLPGYPTTLTWQPSLSVQLPEENEQVAPAELHSILKRLHRILIKRFVLCIAMALCITGELTVCLTSEGCSLSEKLSLLSHAFIHAFMLLFWCYYTWHIKICRELPGRDILQALRDEMMWAILAKGLRWPKSMHSTAHLSLENHDLVSLCILLEHKWKQDEIESAKLPIILDRATGALLVVEFFLLLHCHVVQEITESVKFMIACYMNTQLRIRHQEITLEYLDGNRHFISCQVLTVCADAFSILPHVACWLWDLGMH
jgi:hypothetical protein